MPSYRAGSAFIEVVPSLRGFQTKLKAEVEKLRPVEVKVTPEISEADRAKVETELDETTRDRKPKIKPEVDDVAASARLAELTSRVDEFARKRAEAELSVSDLRGFSKAQSELRLLQRQMGALDAHIKAEADTADAEAALNEVARTRTARINADVDRGPGLGLLGTAGVALGPALIPAAAAATGLVTALSAPLAAAGGGGTLYALIAGKRVSDTNKAIKALQQLHDKVLADKKAVASAATAASRATAQKTLTADTKAYRDALNALNPAQRQFADNLDTLRTRYERLSQRSHVLDPINSGLGLLATIMPRLQRPLASVTDTLDGLLSRAERGVKNGALDGLFKFIEKWNGPAINGLADTTWNIARGIGGIIKAAAPMGGKLLDNIESWSEGFADIGKSKGLKNFLGYVRKEGPEVAHTLGDVAGATVHILDALAPIGHIGLKAIDGLANGVKKIPTGVLTTAGGALAGILVSLKGIRAAKGAVSALAGLKGLGSIGGGRGGLLGAGLKGLGRGVVPVYVTNEGFGKPGRGPAGGPGSKVGRGVGRGGGLLSLLGAFAPELGIAGGLGLFSGYVATHPPKLTGHTENVLRSANARPGYQGGAMGWDPAAHQIRDNTKALLENKRATHANAEQKAALNNLLLSPALPHYGKTLRSLPKKVQTLIATPGAVKSGQDVARLAKQYHLTPKQVRTVVNLLGAQGALGETIRLGRQYHLTPKQVRTIISQAGMDHSQAEIRRLAHQYDITPKQVRTLISATNRASGVIARVKAQLASIPRSIRTDYYVNTVNAGIKHQNFGYGRSAEGSTVPKGGTYADRYPYLLAPGEEVISNRDGQADRWRPLLKAINAGRLAGGGTARGSWLDDFRGHGGDRDLADAIRGLKRELHRQHDLDKGEKKRLNKRLDRLEGIRSAVGGFSVRSTLGDLLGGPPKNPINAGVRKELASFEHDLRKAGGHWTKAMERHADRMRREAIDIDRTNRKRDRLSKSLDKQQSALEQLRSTMDTYSSTVGGNFLTNPFGQAVQMQTDPAVATQLAAAKSRLAGIQGNAALDPLARSAAASKQMLEVQRLTKLAASSQVPVSTLDAFRSTLLDDITHATEFKAALEKLAGEGLNKGLFSGLAASGDYATAEALASLSQGQLAQFNALWTQRAQAAAAVAAYATDRVYGKQEAAAAKAVRQSTRAIEAADRRAHHDAQQIQNQLGAIKSEVRSLPKATQHAKRGGKGRG